MFNFGELNTISSLQVFEHHCGIDFEVQVDGSRFAIWCERRISLFELDGLRNRVVLAFNSPTEDG